MNGHVASAVPPLLSPTPGAERGASRTLPPAWNSSVLRTWKNTTSVPQGPMSAIVVYRPAMRLAGTASAPVVRGEAAWALVAARARPRRRGRTCMADSDAVDAPVWRGGDPARPASG